MALEFETVDIPAQPCVYVPFTCAIADLSEHFMKHLPAAFVYASQNGGQIAGAPFGRYPGWRETDCDVEAGVPIAAAIPESDDVKVGTLGGFRAVKAVHRGPYSKLSETHGAIHTFMTEKGMPITGAPFELYVDDPGEIAEDECRTEVYWPTS